MSNIFAIFGKCTICYHKCWASCLRYFVSLFTDTIVENVIYIICYHKERRCWQYISFVVSYKIISYLNIIFLCSDIIDENHISVMTLLMLSVLIQSIVDGK